MNVETLLTDGFVSVTYPDPLRTHVEHAMESWRNFCDLPLHEKKKISGGDRIRDFGYMLRNDSGPHADNKEIFHAVRNLIEELGAKAAKVPDKRASALVDAVDVLLKASASLVQAFGREVETCYGLSGFEEEVANSQDTWTFRYVHYFGGEILAHPHVDRGGFTFHLYESDKGGEYLGFDGVWYPWPVSKRKTIIFPSMGLQYRSENKLKGLWHRVQPTQASSENGRYSMVAFIDFIQPYRYNDAKKRLQEFPQGFNYTMPYDEFKGLFVPRLPRHS